MAEPILQTSRLRLRPFRASDLAAMHDILRDPLALRYGAFAPHSSMAQTDPWLEAKIALDPKDGEDLVMELDGHPIGKVGFPAFPHAGILIHPRHWRQGFAREALAPVLERAFGLHGLPVVKASIDPRNTASLRLFEGLGFTEVG